MKRMSLKWKVTLWYASMFLLLVVLLFGFLLSVSDQILRSESISALEDAVWDFIEEIEIKGDGWELDDDIRFYEGSIVFSLYDENGRLLAGSVPRNFPADTTLKAYAVQGFSSGSEKWTTYDAAVPYGNERILWVRGTYGADVLTTMERLLLHLLLVGGPLLTVIAIFVGYSITRRALLPIEEIRKTAEEIGEGSDLSLRVSTERTSGEVRQLADTFNHMFDRLEQTFEKERQFTSDASHELRTPTAVILSQAEYALLPDTEPEEMREGLEVIKKQAQRMSGLLSQLLLLARADNGSAQLTKESLDIGVVALNALEEVRLRAGQRHVELQSDLQPDLRVWADRVSLTGAFLNLLENAVQYGREDGWVRLSVTEENGFAVCRVEDNGIGIKPEHLDKIWNRFYRVDTVRGSEYGNSGLGLPIVKWIVEQHGGTVQAESHVGEGSCFTIKLPVEKK